MSVPYKQNYYVVKNKDKYKGNSDPFYRSAFEERVLSYFDLNENVVEWSSESFMIPYLFTVDNKIHRYYPDMKVKMKTNDGIKTFIIEVKPYKQTQPPEKPKKNTAKRISRFNNELFMYKRNLDKWDAAKEYCKKHGYIFKVITEKSIYNGQRK
jgi:hypothetical protein